MKKLFYLLVVFTFVVSGLSVTTGCAKFRGGEEQLKPKQERVSIFERLGRNRKKADKEEDQPSFKASAPISSPTASSEQDDRRGEPARTVRTTTPDSGVVYYLRPNDPLIIILSGIPSDREIQDVIDENGYITLPYIGSLLAAGRTGTQLERAIQRAYIDKQIYRHVDVNVLIPSQSYYVRGEVRKPGRFPLTGSMTVMQAMAAAGGYTEFANPKKIKVLRGNDTIPVNMVKLEDNPQRDFNLEAGDVIVVPRSVF